MIKEIDSIMIDESYEGGASLFREGDPASNFYILGDGTAYPVSSRRITVAIDTDPVRNSK